MSADEMARQCPSDTAPTEPIMQEQAGAGPVSVKQLSQGAWLIDPGSIKE
jgi:hypothetical protein